MRMLKPSCLLIDLPQGHPGYITFLIMSKLSLPEFSI